MTGDNMSTAISSKQQPQFLDSSINSAENCQEQQRGTLLDLYANQQQRSNRDKEKDSFATLSVRRFIVYAIIWSLDVVLTILLTTSFVVPG